MTVATQYAKALFVLVSKNEAEGKKFVRNLRQTLERRGHIKLLPQIFSEYKKIVAAGERAELHKKVTPEMERTRALLELYRKLITND